MNTNTGATLQKFNDCNFSTGEMLQKINDCEVKINNLDSKISELGFALVVVSSIMLVRTLFDIIYPPLRRNLDYL